MKEIIIESKKFGTKTVLVDDEDFEYLSKFNWYIQKGKHTFYVYRKGKEGNIIAMHRQLLGLSDSKVFSDHKDRSGLNNQRNNLRIATQSQNEANKVAHKGSVSKYFGVCWEKQYKKWKARICKNKISVHLGYFENESDAAIAYNKAAVSYHGEFANLNIV
jgi:hypothetical protein